jgi:carbon monoxide dehydrogenase subunit G
MVEIGVDLRYTLQVGWDVEQAFAMVSDVPGSAANFPGLERLDDLGDGVYRWNMRPFEFSRFRHQVRYAARYTSDAAAGTVIWTTEGSDGNTRADGIWRVVPDGDGARLSFENHLAVMLPVPRLVARAARKVVPSVMDKQTRKYLERIAQKMGGRLVG